MSIDSDPQRRPISMRYQDADYSDPGIYFITIRTHNGANIFGTIVKGEMVTNPSGEIVWQVWRVLPKRFPQISIDAAIVMPNHFHGIVIIHEEIAKIEEEKELAFPIGRRERRKMTLPLIVGYFKMNTAKQINQFRGTAGSPVWQRNYYDRILRDDRDYEELSEYIFSNPQRWGIDKE
jgi:REP element-mobilizing transposase RayT